VLDFVYGNQENILTNKFICQFVKDRTDSASGDFGPCGSLGIFTDKTLIAGVIFHNWVPANGTIEVSAAADNSKWLSRRVIREIMKICFKQHNCQMILSRMDSTNERAIQIYRYLKFVEIPIPNLYGKNKTGIIMCLTCDDWNANLLSEI
jgi:RimJ/RimL family protein N-acetyltransferase